MRKIFRIASFALMLAVGVACNNDDVPQEPMGTYPILFRCEDETRAGSNIESLKTDGFKVYAYFEGNNQKSNFEKAVKHYKAEEDTFYWNFEEGVEYWIPGATYWFKAVYPKAIGSVEYASQSFPKLKIENFDISSQTDLLVAEAGPLTVDPVLGAPESGSVVSLQFKHLLANVSVMVKSEISDVKVKTITFANVANKGNLNGNDWSSNEETTLTKSMEVSLDKDADFVDVTDGGFLVIPQGIDGSKQKLYIETSHKEYNDITIPKITWESGKRYAYTLIIKQENIVFNEPTVEEWDEENATGSVIIK